MIRIANNALRKWKIDKHRKPLVMRGARQVGKTTAVRTLAKEFTHYVELNFEISKKLMSIFDPDLEPQRIITDIQLMTGEQIIPGKTLLFFDEIQACPQALIALRYFYEKLPDLHVIAAGSLLDFAIDEVGIPVGRVQFLYMYPMSFIEFLLALGENNVAAAILKQNASTPFSHTVHEKALRLIGEYIAIGGMPEAVKQWCEDHNYQACLDIHHDLLTAFKQDFQKYARESQIKYVEHLFRHIPYQICQTFKFNHIPGSFRKRELEPALTLLTKAKIAVPITHSSGHGLPLGAQAKPDTYKLILLDVALTQALLGVNSAEWILETEKTFINKGMIAEALVGQEILAYSDPRQPCSLYYWQREERTGQAEVDYLIVQDQQVVPVEVKAGKGSTLKSMHQFLVEHPQSTVGIRYSTQNYSVYDGILSKPLYAVGSGYPLDLPV